MACHLSVKFLRGLLATLLFSLFAAAASANSVVIGVLAYDGKDHALNRWQPTADYLSRHIPGRQFKIHPLTHEEFEHVINKDELSFILTNPGHYVRLEVRFGVTRIATFLSQHQGKTLMRFSSVLFSRSDAGINSLGDLKGRRLAAVSKDAFGGFQLAQDLLLRQGIDPLQDMRVLWLGFPHADVVRAVIGGKADAGVVRSGTLENMARRGELDLSRIRVLAQKNTPGYPFLHSVDLYPEWPIAKLRRTDTALAKQVAVTLMKMESNDEAARKAGGAGWTIPLSYTSVHDVLRRLQVAPYPPAPLSLARFWEAYWHWIVVIAALFLFSLMTLLRLFRANRQLQSTQQALHKHQGQLEEAVHQRTEELRQTNRALKDEIVYHVKAEKTLNEGCEALQDLSAIFVRDDLGRQQRLHSIVESLKHYLGAETALLSSIHGDEFAACGGPDNAEMSAPLSTTLASRAIRSKQIFVCEDDEDWRQYIACPVYASGALRCLLEVATSPRYFAEHGDAQGRMSSELSLKILALIAQWMGYEMLLLEREQEASRKHQNIRQRFTAITARENDVMTLLARGESTKSMARMLNLSPKTIEMHRASLLRKTHCKSSTELVQLAVLSGLFSEIQ